MSHGEYTDIERRKLVENERLDEKRDFELSRSGLNEAVGKIGNYNASSDRFLRDEEDRRKKKADDYRMAADISRRMAELQQTINDADEAIGAGNKVLGLMRDGKLDRDNADHVELMVLAGLDPKDMTLTEDDVQRKIDENQRIKDDAERKMDDLQASPELSSERDRVERKEIIVEHEAIQESLLDMGGENLDDLFAEIDGMSFADEIEPSPITTEVSLTNDFGRAASAVDATVTIKPTVERESTMEMGMNL